MDISKVRVEALKAVMAGASQKDFANQHGLDASYLSQILNGHRNLGEKAAATLEMKIGLPAGSLVTPGGQGGKPEIQEATSAAEAVMQMLAKHGKGLSEDARKKIASATEMSAEVVRTGNVITADFSQPGPVGDEIRIAHYDIQASMGQGGKLPPDYPEVLRDLVVSQKQLRDLGLQYQDHSYLKVVNGWGQSMAPTIRHRDPLIVDISVREFAGDGVYLLVWEDLLYIKRLQVADAEHYEMISDNPAHKDRMVLREDIHIQARVLMVWNAQLL